jgi:hypothetical protein
MAGRGERLGRFACGASALILLFNSKAVIERARIAVAKSVGECSLIEGNGQLP